MKKYKTNANFLALVKNTDPALLAYTKHVINWYKKTGSVKGEFDGLYDAPYGDPHEPVQTVARMIRENCSDYVIPVICRDMRNSVLRDYYYEDHMDANFRAWYRKEFMSDCGDV